MKPMEFLVSAVLFAVWDLTSSNLALELMSMVFFVLWAVASFRQFAIEGRAVRVEE